MKKLEENQNSGESVFLISGSERGIKITLLGEQEKIISIMKLAVKSSITVREVLAVLSDGEGNEKKNRTFKR